MPAPRMLPVGLLLVTIFTGFGPVDPVQADERTIDLINGSEDAILSVQASTPGTGTWGPDLLGRSVLEANRRTRLHLAHARRACRYDVRAIMETGVELTRPGLNLCAQPELVVR